MTHCIVSAQQPPGTYTLLRTSDITDAGGDGYYWKTVNALRRYDSSRNNAGKDKWFASLTRANVGRLICLFRPWYVFLRRI